MPQKAGNVRTTVGPALAAYWIQYVQYEGAQKTNKTAKEQHQVTEPTKY